MPPDCSIHTAEVVSSDAEKTLQFGALSDIFAGPALQDRLQIQSLRVLHLENSFLTALPEDLGLICLSLEEVYLDNNQLTELPASFGKCRNLRILSVQSNQLKKLPTEIASWTALRTLNLSSNRLEQIPADLGSVPNLTSLDISLNDFVSLPAWQHTRNQSQTPGPSVRCGSSEKTKDEIGHASADRAVVFPSLQVVTLEWFRYCSPSLPPTLSSSNEVTSPSFQRFLSIIRGANSGDQHGATARDISTPPTTISAIDLIHRMSSKPVIIDGVDRRRGRSRLHFAAAEHHRGMIRALLEAGLRVDALNAHGFSALLLAVREGHYEAAKLLIENGAPTRHGGGHLGSALHVATVNLDSRMCRLLVENGCSPSIPDLDGNTSLHVLLSIFDRDPEAGIEVAEVLLNAGACCNTSNQDRWGALHLASRRGQVAAVSYAVTTVLRAPLACRQGTCEHAITPGSPRTRTLSSVSAFSPVCKNAPAFSVSPVTKPQQSQSPNGGDLSVALRRRCPRVFDLDLQGGTHHWTALHLAGHANKAKVIQVLLRGGANPLICNKNGKTPRDVARGNYVATKLLFAGEQDFLLVKTQPWLRALVTDCKANTAVPHVTQLSVPVVSRPTQYPGILMVQKVFTSVYYKLFDWNATDAHVSSQHGVTVGVQLRKTGLKPTDAPRSAARMKQAAGDCDSAEKTPAVDVSEKRPSSLPKAAFERLSDAAKTLAGPSVHHVENKTVIDSLLNFHPTTVNEPIDPKKDFSGFRDFLEFRVQTPSTVLKKQDVEHCDSARSRFEALRILVDSYNRNAGVIGPYSPSVVPGLHAPYLSEAVDVSLIITSISPLTNAAGRRIIATLLSFFAVNKQETDPYARLSSRLEALRIALLLGAEDLVHYTTQSLGVDGNRMAQLRDADGETLIHLLCQKHRRCASDAPGSEAALRAESVRADLLTYFLQLEKCTWNLDALDLRGLAPLHLAIKQLNFPVVQTLLFNGANPNQVENTTGWTPLLLAVSSPPGSSRDFIIQLLLCHPLLDVDTGDFFEWSPLHEALARLDIRTTSLLVSRGASEGLHGGQTLEQVWRTACVNVSTESENQFVKFIDPTLKKNFILPNGTNPKFSYAFRVQKDDIGARNLSGSTERPVRKLLGIPVNNMTEGKSGQSRPGSALLHRSFVFAEPYYCCLICSARAASIGKLFICAGCHIPVCGLCSSCRNVVIPSLHDIPRRYLQLASAPKETEQQQRSQKRAKPGLLCSELLTGVHNASEFTHVKPEPDDSMSFQPNPDNGSRSENRSLALCSPQSQGKRNVTCDFGNTECFGAPNRNVGTGDEPLASEIDDFGQVTPFNTNTTLRYGRDLCGNVTKHRKPTVARVSGAEWSMLLANHRVSASPKSSRGGRNPPATAPSATRLCSKCYLFLKTLPGHSAAP